MEQRFEYKQAPNLNLKKTAESGDYGLVFFWQGGGQQYFETFLLKRAHIWTSEAWQIL